jgi:ANTAR domain
MPTVSVDEHGRIRRVSAPQWSTGRPIKRSPAAPPQTRGARPLPSTLGPAPVEPAQTVPDLAVADLSGPDLADPDPAVLDPAVLSSAGPGLARPGLAGPGFVDSDRADPDPGLTGGGPHPVELAGLLHELSALLLSADDLPQALHRLAAFTAGAVPGAWRCSVVLIGERAPLTVAASGPHAQAFDDLQYATGQGPGLDAARTRTLVTAHDVARDPRWPELSDCARAEGLHAVAAIPLDVQRSWVGALSLYARRGEGIGPDLLLTAMALVGQAEVLLGEHRRRAALGEGGTVDRAAGVIIAQRGCGVHEAYDVLEDTANRLGLDRHTVADRLVAAAASRHPDP